MRLAAVAAAAIPAVSAPVAWDFLGYSYQPGPVIVSVLAVAITRAILFIQNNSRRQWVLDVFVTLLCALVSALWTQAHELQLLTAGITGIGISGIGLGIIGIAKSQVGAALKVGLQTMLKALASSDTKPGG